MISRYTLIIFCAFIYFGVISCKHEPIDIIKPIIVDTTHFNNNKIDSICFFEDIRPILLTNCAKSGCHDDTTKKKGIVLTSYLNVTMTISGNLLLQSILDNGPLGMPPSTYPKLDSIQIAHIKAWVDEGMKDNIDCQGPCDSANITFSSTIYPIIKNNCLGCHSNSTSGTYLVGYPSVKTAVTNGKLFCTINRTNGCRPMPDGLPKLSECKLRLIKKWIDAGSPNN